MTDGHRALLRVNNLPVQHVAADELPLPELPSIISKTSSSSKLEDLPLQYSIEEEDAGNSEPSTATCDAATDGCRQSKSEC